MSLPINNLPAIDIDEEIARAKENWFKLCVEPICES